MDFVDLRSQNKISLRILLFLYMSISKGNVSRGYGTEPDPRWVKADNLTHQNMHQALQIVK